MGDMRYVNILKQPPASQIYHFHTTTERVLLTTDVSKGRKRESKIEEDIEQMGHNTSSSMPVEVIVVSNRFCFSDNLVYIWVEKTLPEDSLSLNIVGHV